MSIATSELLNQAESSTGSDIDLSRLIDRLLNTMHHAIGKIEQLNSQTKLLSLNARIEAGRAGGTVGAAFGVVAQEIQALSVTTADVTGQLSRDSSATISEIQTRVEHFATQARGQRLSDLALTAVDLIDRNLYERSCDVRWWATDHSLVDALLTPDQQAREYASQRLGVILDAYTVYYDLVLCDLDGNVVANGRPAQFPSVGTNVGNQSWFRDAIVTRSGGEFTFQSAHDSPLVGHRQVLTYACGVREDGRADGRLVGVLGILFNWDALGQKIVEQTIAGCSSLSRCVISDSQGISLADTVVGEKGRKLTVPLLPEALSSRKGYRITNWDGQAWCLAFATAPGFETYTTGWHCLLMEPVE